MLPHLGKMQSAARRYSRTQADAEDLVQETMLRAYTGIHTFKDGTSITAWLYRIMTNTWINRYRATQYRPIEYLSDELTEAQMVVHAQYDATSLSPVEQKVFDSMADDEVRRALMALPEGQRLAVYYTDVEGFRYKEVADMLGMPLGTVMSRLHRGRQNLRVALKDVARARRYQLRDKATRRCDERQPTGLTDSTAEL